LFLANDKAAIRKALLRLRYLDKFAEEARARRANIERATA
jgi:molecular chaperone HscB